MAGPNNYTISLRPIARNRELGVPACWSMSTRDHDLAIAEMVSLIPLQTSPLSSSPWLKSDLAVLL